MLTSYKNSTIVNISVVSAVSLLVNLFIVSPAGATGEATPQPTVAVDTTTQVQQPDPVTTPPTNEDIFFSQPRTNPYSDAELAHEPNAAELRGDSWESRVANCNTLVDYNSYADCMFRPWLFGY